jgi:hypothetical protein
LNFLRFSTTKTRKARRFFFKGNSCWFLYPRSFSFPQRLQQPSQATQVLPKKNAWRPMSNTPTSAKRRLQSNCINCICLTYHCSAIPKAQHIKNRPY